jgi:hypothetical protein
MIKRYLLLVLFVCTLDVSATSQQIQIYRWTDNNGLIHFSQFPPKGKIDSNKIIMEQPIIPISSAEKEKNSKNLMVDIQKYIKERQNLRKTKAIERKTDKSKCVAARKSLEFYQSGRRIRLQYNEGKDNSILSENERKISIKRAEKDIKSYC